MDSNLPDPMGEYRDLARELRLAADFIDLACDGRIQMDSLSLVGAVTAFAAIEAEFEKAKRLVERDIETTIAEAVAAAVTQDDLVAMRNLDTSALPEPRSTGRGLIIWLAASVVAALTLLAAALLTAYCSDHWSKWVSALDSLLGRGVGIRRP